VLPFEELVELDAEFAIWNTLRSLEIEYSIKKYVIGKES
jgi:hypothetical protein